MPRGRPRKDDANERHPLYHRWCMMRKRCENPNRPEFRRYGGRGIAVCDRWQDFRLFAADMGLPPSIHHTIEREDNDGPYSPDNCVWALPDTQANNTRRVRKITYGGKTKTLSQWAKELEIEYNLFRRNVDKLGFEQAITRGNQKRSPGWHHSQKETEPPLEWDL